MSDLDPAHVEAVAEILWRAHPDSASRPWATQDGFTRAPYRVQALRLLRSRSPSIHAALLAALARAGVLSGETRSADVRWKPREGIQHRYVTRWEDRNA